MPKINPIKPEVFDQKTTISYEEFLKEVKKKEESNINKHNENLKDKAKGK